MANNLGKSYHTEGRELVPSIECFVVTSRTVKLGKKFTGDFSIQKFFKIWANPGLFSLIFVLFSMEGTDESIE